MSDEGDARSFVRPLSDASSIRGCGGDFTA